MKLMMAMMFVFIVLGLVARRHRGYEPFMIAGLATVMTALYFFFAERFM